MVLLISLLLVGFGCAKTPPPGEPFPHDPVVAVHGFLASGDTWAPLFQRLADRGSYPDAYLRAYDYNSLGDDAVSLAGLDAFIDGVLAETGAQRVVLIGHSKGGGLSYTYLEDPAHVAKVSHYVHVGSFPSDSTVGPMGNELPMLNLYSPDDLVVTGADIPGAENRSLAGLDHYQVATDLQCTEAIWTFVHNSPLPEASPEAPGSAESIGGKALAFGQNTPLNGATVEVWLRDAEGKARASDQPVATFSVDEQGAWGPVDLLNDRFYEFVLQPATGRTVYSYTPQLEGNRWLYLRGVPPPTSLAGLLLSGLPQDPDQSVVALFMARQAVVAGRDALAVDGVSLSTEALASADQTSIAFFLYDDGDQSSSYDPDPAFAALPFVQAVDVFLPPDGAFFRVERESDWVEVPARPSDEGLSLVILL